MNSMTTYNAVSSAETQKRTDESQSNMNQPSSNSIQVANQFNQPLQTPSRKRRRINVEQLQQILEAPFTSEEMQEFDLKLKIALQNGVITSSDLADYYRNKSDIEPQSFITCKKQANLPKNSAQATDFYARIHDPALQARAKLFKQSALAQLKTAAETQMTVSEYTETVFPQGITISHEVPALSHFTEALKDVKDSALDAISFFFEGKIFDQMCFYLLVGCIFCGIVIASTPKHSVTRNKITHLQLVLINIITFIVTYNMVFNIESLNAKVANLTEAMGEEIFLYRQALQEQADSLPQPTTETEITMEEIIVPQGMADFLPGGVTLIALCIAGLTGFRPKDPLLNSVVNLSKISQTQTSNFTTMFITFCTGVSKIFLDLGMPDVSKYFEMGILDDSVLNDYVKQVNAFVSQTNAGNLNSHMYFSEVYEDFTVRGMAHLKVVDKSSYESRVLTETLKNLKLCYEKAESIRNSLSGLRIEPVSVIIRGAPGTMKSELCARLSRIVAHHTLPEEWQEDFKKNPKEFFYSLPSDKWYDGYTNKAWIVMKDDIFQVRDCVGDRESDAIKVINIVNTQPYTLPMAEVTLKNNTYYRSPFFFSTSNVVNYNLIQSVQSTSAVARRFHLEIDVTVNPKYVNQAGKLEVGTLPTDSIELAEEILTGTFIPDDYWQLRITRKTANKVHEPITGDIKILSLMVLEEYKLHIKNYCFNRKSDSAAVEDIYADTETAKRISNMYSSLYMSSIKPQSGLTDDGDYADEADELWEEIDLEKRVELESRYYHIVSCFMTSNHMHYFAQGALINLVKNYHLTEVLIQHIIEEDGNPEVFWARIELLVGNLVGRGISPVTLTRLKPLPAPCSIKAFLKRIRHTFNSAVEFLKKYKFFFIVGIPIVLGGVYYLSKFVSSISGTTDNAQSSLDFTKDRARAPGKKPAVSLSKYMGDRANTQMNLDIVDIDFEKVHDKIKSFNLGSDDSSTSIIASIINKGMFVMYVKTPDNTYRMGHALNLRGQIFLAPFHFMYQLQDLAKDVGVDNAKIFLATATNSTIFSCPLSAMFKNFKLTTDAADNDMVVFRIESAHRNAVGLMKYIMEEKDLVNLKNKSHNFRGTITGTFTERTNKDLVLLRSTSVLANFHGEIIVNSNWEGKQVFPVYALPNIIAYEGNFRAGDCGSVLTVESSQYASRILCGFHVAGGEKKGYSTILVKERLETLLLEIENKEIHVLNDDLPDFVTPTPIEAQGFKQPIGTLAPANTPSNVTKSDYTKSRMFGKLPEPFKDVKHYPARLAPFKTIVDGETITVDPLLKAFNKYGKHPHQVDPVVLQEAIGSYEELITQHMDVPYSSRGVVPLQQALHSFNNIKGISPSSSAGYPMTLPGRENLKKLYYNAVFENDKPNIDKYYEQIANLVQVAKNQYMEGKRVPHFYKGCSKDGIVTADKVADGKTRMFLSGSFIYLVMCRMYFGSFMSAFVGANYKVGSAIGVNPYSSEWDIVARELLKFGNDREKLNIGAGDYAEYDVTQYSQVHWELFEMMIRWSGTSYSDDDKQIAFFLFVELVNSRHIVNGKVFEWNSGMPSGNFLTAMINTMNNNICFRMSYHYAGYAVLDFNAHVYLIALGDDNVFSVSDKDCAHFNEKNMPEYMKIIGMKYTTELKGIATQPFRKLCEVDFLKRSFIFDKSLNRYIAPMRLESLFIPLNWKSKGELGDQINVNQISSTLNELALHDQQTFDKYYQPLTELKNKYYSGYQPDMVVSPNWRAARANILSSEHMY